MSAEQAGKWRREFEMPKGQVTNGYLRAPIPPRAEIPHQPTTFNSFGSASSRVLLADFRCGEAVEQHPDVLPLLNEGWAIKSAVPRLVEGEGVKLLVVLHRAARVLS